MNADKRRSRAASGPIGVYRRSSAANSVFGFHALCPLRSRRSPFLSSSVPLCLCGEFPMKTRLDRLLVERGLADRAKRRRRSSWRAKSCWTGRKLPNPASRSIVDAAVEVLARPPFVSRGGLKLEAALAAFRHRRRGPGLPRYRSLHRRLHRLPAAARRGARARRGCRRRPARLETAHRSARRGRTRSINARYLRLGRYRRAASTCAPATSASFR